MWEALGKKFGEIPHTDPHRAIRASVTINHDDVEHFQAMNEWTDAAKRAVFGFEGDAPVALHLKAERAGVRMMDEYPPTLTVSLARIA